MKKIPFDIAFEKRAEICKLIISGDVDRVRKIAKIYNSEELFFDNYVEQASALASGGVDGFIIQTMTDLREAVCALKACKSVSYLPVIVSLAFSAVSGGGRTVMGDNIAEISSILEKHGASIIGANCGELSPYEMALLVGLYKKCTSLPVIVQPNAGKPQLLNSQVIYDMSPEDFADGLMKCIEEGAVYVGGCCGTTVEHIKALNQRI